MSHGFTITLNEQRVDTNASETLFDVAQRESRYQGIGQVPDLWHL